MINMNPFQSKDAEKLIVDKPFMIRMSVKMHDIKQMALKKPYSAM